MARASTKAQGVRTSSRGPVVGGIGSGAGIGWIATKIVDPFWRDIVTVSAPVIAVSITVVGGAVGEIFRSWLQNFVHWWHARNTTKYAKQVLGDPNSTEHVKAVAAEAIANVQLQTLAHYQNNLNRVAQVIPQSVRPQNIANGGVVSTAKKEARRG